MIVFISELVGKVDLVKYLCFETVFIPKHQYLVSLE